MELTWLFLQKDGVARHGVEESGDKLMTTQQFLTGFGLTTSLNADGLLSFQSNGWGRNTWNSESWGESE